MDNKKIEDQLHSIEKKLDEVIVEVERKRSTGIIDLLTAILLSLATVGSAWCAFQSTLWDGNQTFELMDANMAGRLSSQNMIEANQIKSLHATLLMEYINAEKTGNKELSEFYFNRFDPNLKKATLEWLKLDPFNNTDVPNSPLAMDSYILDEEKKYESEMDNYEKKMEDANLANKHSDNYVMLTVIFAAVLFFGGIASTLKSTLMRNGSILLSGIILVISIILLLFLPVARIF